MLPSAERPSDTQTMRIIPVVDLQESIVVRGVAGQRATYGPVESVLCAEATPAAVARGFVERLSLTEAYVADLDAIAGAEPDWQRYGELMSEGLSIWVDAGAASVERAKGLAEWRIDGARIARVIVGLETLPGVDALRAMLAVIGRERLVFSLDLKEGQPLCPPGTWTDFDAERIANHALEAGVASMIVLDLTRVGVGAGLSTLELCRRIRKKSPDLELISGGGVRGIDDLQNLSDAGCDAALVASALHDGRIGRQDLADV